MFAVKSFEMQKMDQYMINNMGIPSCVLMENAAKSIVDDIIIRYPIINKEDKSITIICGTGNNGGDGIAIGRWLIHIGYYVQLIVVGKKEKASEDHQLQMSIFEKMIEIKSEHSLVWINEDNFEKNSYSIQSNLKKSLFVLDCLLGTGCNRTVSVLYKEIIEYINTYSPNVIAVDVPSGINSDNGKVMGAAVSADITYTFSAPKIGLLLFPGTEYTGELLVNDIGICKEAEALIQQKVEVLNQMSIRDAFAQGVFNRKKNTHKGSFGIVGIIAGDSMMLGATILAIRAAYRTGAGLVKAFVSKDNAQTIIAQVPECVIIPYNEADKLETQLDNFANQVDLLAIGPGLSQSNYAQNLVRHVLQVDKKIVFDADALNIIAKNMDWLEEKKCECIITPHIGEMSRLTGYCSSGILENPIHFASAMYSQYDVVTVLKSARTVIASNNNQMYINTLGNPGMSTAGSGDVLVGVVSGLLAQHFSLDDAAKYGVLLHSYAGDFYAEKNNMPSLMASDIIESLWKGL